MQLKEYLSNLERGGASKFAMELGVSLSYLLQMASGASPISPVRAVEIEKLSNGEVTRKDMFSDDWQKIWPELESKECAKGMPVNCERHRAPSRRSKDKKSP